MVRLLKRVLRVLFWTVLGVVVVGGAAYLLRVPLFGGLVKRTITSRLSEALGGRYEIEAVGGNWIREFDLRGLKTVEAPATGPLVGLGAAEATVRYDLRTLLSEDPIEGIEALRVGGLRLDLDPTRPSEARDGSSPLDLSVPDGFRARIDVAGTVSVKTGSGPAELRDLRVGYGPLHVLDLDVGEVSLPERFAVGGPFAGRVNRVNERTWRWLSDAELGGVRVPQATIRSDGALEGVVEVAGGRLDVSLADQVLTVRSEGLDLARLPTWIADLLPEGEPLPTEGRVAGGGQVVLTDPRGASFTAAGVGIRWRDETISNVEVEGAWREDGESTIERLDLVSGKGMVRLRKAVLDPRLPFWLRDIGELSVEIASTKALLPELGRDFAVSLDASSSGARTLLLERLIVEDAALRLEARGRATLPEDLDAWRRTVLEVDVQGFVGDLAPLDVALDGRLDVQGRLQGDLDALRGTLRLQGRVREQEIESATLDATLSWPEVQVHGIQARAAGAELDARGRVELEPFSVPELSGRIDVPDLRRVADLVASDLPVLAGRLQASGRLRYSADVLDVAARLTADDVVVDGNEIGAVEATVRSEGRRAIVDALRAEGAWGRAHATGEILPDEGRALVQGLLVETEGATLSLGAPLGLRWAEGAIAADGLVLDLPDGRLTGDVLARPARGELEVSRLLYETEALRLRLAAPLAARWKDARLEIPSLVVVDDEELSVRAALVVDLSESRGEIVSLAARSELGEARLNAPLRVALKNDVLAIAGLDLTAEGARIVGAGRVDWKRAEATVEQLAVRKKDVDARLRTPATVRWPSGLVEIEGLDVSALGGRLTGRMTIAETLDAELEGHGFALARFVPDLHGEVAFLARARDGTWAIAAEVPVLRFREWEGALSAKVRQRPVGGIEVVEARLTGPRGGSLVGRALMPYRLSGAGFVVQEDVPPTLALEGAIGGLASFTDVAKGPVRIRAVGDRDGISAEIRVDDLGLCDEEALCDDGVARLRIDRQKVAATISLLNDEFMRVRGHVNLDRGFDWTHPETASGLLAQANLDAELEALVRAWGPLAEHAPGLRRLQGGAQVTLQARGTVKEPRVRGDIRLSDFSLAADTDLAPLDQVNAHLVWEDRILRIQRLDGLMGYAPFSIRGSLDVGFDRLPIVDVTLEGRNLQLLRTDYLRMRIDVDAAAKGPLDALKVTGVGKIVDLLYRKPVSLAGATAPGGTPEILLFQIRDRIFSNMEFDLAVEAQDSLRIRNNFLRMNASFEGRLRGTGERPEFNGRLWFRDGEVFLPVTTLRRASGDVVFRSEAPFRPRIQMTAQTRTRGYEMGVQVAGALPDVHLYVFTEPRLSDEDAILMLTTGSTSAELAGGGILGQGLAVVFNLFGGSAVTSRGGDGEPGEKAFFERFEFTSDWQGTRIQEITGEFEVTDRFFLQLEQDRFQTTNLGLLWRLRFR